MEVIRLNEWKLIARGNAVEHIGGELNLLELKFSLLYGAFLRNNASLCFDFNVNMIRQQHSLTVKRSSKVYNIPRNPINGNVSVLAQEENLVKIFRNKYFRFKYCIKVLHEQDKKLAFHIDYQKVEMVPGQRGIVLSKRKTIEVMHKL